MFRYSNYATDRVARAVYQSHFRTDAAWPASGGAFRGRGSASRDTLHHGDQSGGNPVRFAMLPERRRRTMPGVAAAAIFAEDLAGRVLPFHTAAALHYAAFVT